MPIILRCNIGIVRCNIKYEGSVKPESFNTLWSRSFTVTQRGSFVRSQPRPWGSAVLSLLASGRWQWRQLPVSVQNITDSQRAVFTLYHVLCLVCCAWRSNRMPWSCCVPGYRSGYKGNDEKSSMFCLLRDGKRGESGSAPCQGKKQVVSHLTPCMCVSVKSTLMSVTFFTWTSG